MWKKAVEVDEFLTFLAVLLRYRRHVMNTLPEYIARLKDRLTRIKARKNSRHPEIDHEVFYRIGLALISRHQGPMPMGELSKALDVALSTATRMVDELVEEGLAERVADPEDRRVVRVTLTEDGQQLYQITSEYMRQNIDQVLADFTTSERADLVRLLRKARNSMSQNIK